jgi:hypothetical protein
MAANHLPYEPQQMILSESLQERLPDGHLAHCISDAIAGLDSAAVHARYDKGDEVGAADGERRRVVAGCTGVLPTRLASKDRAAYR